MGFFRPRLRELEVQFRVIYNRAVHSLEAEGGASLTFNFESRLVTKRSSFDAKLFLKRNLRLRDVALNFVSDYAADYFRNGVVEASSGRWVPPHQVLGVELVGFAEVKR